MNFETKLRIFHICNHIALVFGIIYGSLWMFGVSFLIWQIIAAIGVSAGLHRYLSHGSFKTTKFWQNVMLFIGIPATAGTPLGWVGVHRMHHANNETENDPHSPSYKGLLNIHFSLWGKVTIPRKYIKDILKNKLIIFVHKYYFFLLFGYASILYLIDPLVGIFCYSIPALLAFHGFGLINGWTHRNGTPTNSWLANILTAGEGWHENHHDTPGDWKIGKKWWQLDTASWFIRIIKI